MRLWLQYLLTFRGERAPKKLIFFCSKFSKKSLKTPFWPVFQNFDFFENPPPPRKNPRSAPDQHLRSPKIFEIYVSIMGGFDPLNTHWVPPFRSGFRRRAGESKRPPLMDLTPYHPMRPKGFACLSVS